MAKRHSSNKSFRKSKYVRKGGGPLHYKWQPKAFEKTKNGKKRYERIEETRENSRNPITGCNGPIDNDVTYVYEILGDGNHEAYVECDYVD